MQDDSNLRLSPISNKSAKGKYIYPNLRQPTKTKTSAKKKYFDSNFNSLIHKAIRFYPPSPISVTVSILTVSIFVLLTLTSIFPTFSLPFNNISSVSPVAVRIQHFFKTLHNHFR
jgi:hypothetical protein